jgi:enamine deaminase RidA (YjgF/YER057c/UK114 family)
LRRPSRVMANAITRLEQDIDPKYASVVVHNSTAYFAGIAELGDGPTQTIEEQSKLCFAEADRVLKLAGCTKSDVLQVMVWLKDINADYASFNAEYVQWIDAANKPVRACVQSSMALPEYLVEIQITAAVP